jgi:hypothetical protein
VNTQRRGTLTTAATRCSDRGGSDRPGWDAYLCPCACATTVPPMTANSSAARGGLAPDRQAPRVSDFQDFRKTQKSIFAQEK